MPKVKNPLFSQEARGGIGGLVFNTWRGINYVKTNTSPTGQGTMKRLAAQAVLITISRLWATIGDVAIAAWNQYANDHPVTDWTGSPKRLTGFNWFMKCNVQLIRIGETTITSPPADPAPNAVTGLSVQLVGSVLAALWTTPATGDLNLDIFLTGPHSLGRTPTIEAAQHLLFRPPTDFYGGTLIAVPTEGRYTAFVRVIDNATGLASSWVSSYGDIPAP